MASMKLPGKTSVQIGSFFQGRMHTAYSTNNNEKNATNLQETLHKQCI